MEPSRCCVSSIALVLLKTGIVHPPGGGQVNVDYNQMATAQKLLLFWRKPAVSLFCCHPEERPLTRMQRKCWWDGVEVDLADTGKPSQLVKLWARRVWTLELSLVRDLSVICDMTLTR